MPVKGPVRGAYQIDELVLMDFSQRNFVDLGNHTQSIIMKESIYQPYLTLEIIVNDTAALHEQLPMLGEEIIFMSWKDGESVTQGDPTRYFRKMFYVISLTNLKDPKPTAQTYTIKAASPEFFMDKKLKVYGGWSGDPYSQIAKEVYDKWLSRPLAKKFPGYEKTLHIEDTKGGGNLACPGWSPIKTLEWLASKSQSNTRGTRGALYMYWESMHGVYFKSIETLMQKTNDFGESDIQLKIPQIHLVPPSVSTGEENVQQAYEQLIPDEYSFPQLFNSAHKLEQGMIANRVVGLDYIHHKVYNYDFYYDQQGIQQGHAYAKNILNSSVSFLNPDPDTRQGKFPVVQVTAISGSGDDRTRDVLSGEGFTRSNRMSQLEQIRQLQFEAVVPYSADYETGSFCYVYIPSKAGTQDSSLNGLTSGKYLVTGLDHLLIAGLYKLRVKLVKESLLQNIDEALDLDTGQEENVSPYSGVPVAGGVGVKQPKRVSAQNDALDPLDEETYKQVSFHELTPSEVGPSS